MPDMKAPSWILPFLLVACGAPSKHGSQPPAPELARLGGQHLPITTNSTVAQTEFDRGLAWCYGFHHEEAMRCFRAGLAADPDCAMLHWGLAYAAGPHINNMAMSEAAAQAAHESVQTAKGLLGTATELERSLVAALEARYAWPAPADRKELDRAYAARMRGVYERFPAHPDVGVLFAESLMNLWPWDLYRADGAPQPDTEEIVAVLERVMASHPRHPQGNHLYIHAVEASRRPERALAAAERLVGLAPAIGHLEHMPAHTFLRVGRYEDAAAANRRGIAADLATVARTGRTGFYELYRAHNYHFLAYAAMFTGNEVEALGAAREMVAELPAEVVRQMPEVLEAYLAVPLHVLVRFGRWRHVLAEPEPAAWQKSTRAVWHYARGVAHAALGEVAAAQRERERFASACDAVPEAWMLANNPVRTVLAIGREFLAGEVEFRAGNHDVAFAALRRAVELDEALRYDEPWGWMMPPAHALGALLLEAGRHAEAETVYLADLARHPDNGWALRGLHECQSHRGDRAAAAATHGRFVAAWRNATVPIDASCFCRR